VFNKLFFPSFDPLTGTLAAFGTQAVGFAARPLGGILCGHFGDRLGRKAMLMLTLLITGCGAVLIGCLPAYGQIGVFAPVLLILLRFVQGIGRDGEWGGAVLMVVEHASTSIFIPLSAMPVADFLSWGGACPS
jgi:MHS family shikimate/dehydroshikimate transporter-like MFS transporter